MHVEAVFILLFVVATTVAVAARRWRVPYTALLVLAGLLLGALDVLEPPHLTKELLFAVFLPGLLFEAAYHLEFRDFRRDLTAITALAVPGVVAAIGLTAVLLTPVAAALEFVADFTWRDALLFGALIAATDPIAVVALFKSLGVPRRLSVLMEGESLLNDGTAIVFFTLILGIVAGSSFTAGGLFLDFVTVTGAGALIGGAVGLGVSHLIQRIDDPMVEITLTTIAAYGSFVAAEELHVSGVIATVTAGMLCGNFAARTGMSPSTRVAVETFWEYLAFALNSIVFLLIGFEVRVPALLASWRPILVAYLVVTLGRGLVVAGAAALIRSREARIPRAWTAVLTWGGLRGGISMVLALSLPVDFPHRALLVTMTFGVVILTILVNGLTMGPLLRRLGIAGGHALHQRYEALRARLQAGHAALGELERMQQRRLVHVDVATPLAARYQELTRALEEEIGALHVEVSGLSQEERFHTERHLLMVEKERIHRAAREGMVGVEARDAALADVDARLAALEEGGPVREA